MNNSMWWAFVLMITGLFFLANLSPGDFVEAFKNLRFYRSKKKIRDRVLEIQNQKKEKGVAKLIKESKVILKMTNKEQMFTQLLLVSFSLSMVGITFGIFMDNYFVMPILLIGFGLIPFWYLRIIKYRWTKDLNDELERSLSMITMSYQRSDNIIEAIEENLESITPPLYNVLKSFIGESMLINSNISMALEKLKNKIDSDVFREWVDALIDCQEDKNLKVTLMPIVEKFSDMKTIAIELENIIREPMKEFVTMACLLVGNIPLLYFLNRDWYASLMTTEIGKCTLAICFGVLFFSFANVVMLSQPIEYRR